MVDYIIRFIKQTHTRGDPNQLLGRAKPTYTNSDQGKSRKANMEQTKKGVDQGENTEKIHSILELNPHEN